MRFELEHHVIAAGMRSTTLFLRGGASPGTPRREITSIQGGVEREPQARGDTEVVAVLGALRQL